jgi:ATP-dependent DNA helicase RecG
MALIKNSIQTELPTIEESKPTIKPTIKAPIPTIKPAILSLEQEFPEISASLWQTIYELGKHTQPDGIKSIIFDLCGIRPFAAEELARILNRNKGWVRTSYLRPMIREGNIEYVNPDHPRQQGQAYRAVKKGKK